MKRILLVLFILFIPVSLPACLQPGLRDGHYRVYRVIDGDTIILERAGCIRLANVHAPELGTPAGDSAALALRSAIGGRTVYIQFTRRKHDSCAGPAGSVCHDRYGRILARIR